MQSTRTIFLAGIAAARIRVVPRFDIASTDGVALKFAREPDAIAAPVQVVRASDAATQHMLAAVTGLRRSFFRKIVLR